MSKALPSYYRVSFGGVDRQILPLLARNTALICRAARHVVGESKVYVPSERSC